MPKSSINSKVRDVLSSYYVYSGVEVSVCVFVDFVRLGLVSLFSREVSSTISDDVNCVVSI